MNVVVMPLRRGRVVGPVLLVKHKRSLFNFSKFADSVSSSSATAQKYTIQKRYPYPQKAMYQLISEVNKYHEFIPYCVDSFIKERDEHDQPIVAGLRVGFKQFDEEFICDLICQSPESVIAKSITHSLFHKLYTKWDIEPINETHCKTKLTLEYEFKNELYNKVSSLFAQHVANLMTKAFEKRAFQLFGNK